MSSKRKASEPCRDRPPRRLKLNLSQRRTEDITTSDSSSGDDDSEDEEDQTDLRMKLGDEQAAEQVAFADALHTLCRLRQKGLVREERLAEGTQSIYDQREELSQEFDEFRQRMSRQVSEIQQQVAELARQVEADKAGYERDIARSERRLKKYKESVPNLENRIAALRKENTQWQPEKQALMKENANLRVAVDKLRAERDRSVEKIKKMKEVLN